MRLRTRLLAALAVVLTSAPAFACHRHRFFSHGCNSAPVSVGVAIAPLVVPLPFPHVVPVPVPVAVASAVVVDDDAPLPPPPMVVATPVEPAPPPAVYVAPPPPPVVYVAPAPPPAPAPVVVAAPAPKPEEPSVPRLAVKWSPGISAVVDVGARAFGPASFTNNFGAEFRLSRYFALRADLELRSGAKSWQVPGLKVSLFPSSRVHPFGSLSLAINQVDGAQGGPSFGVMGAAGLDITLFRWLFLTAEARYATVPGNCCALPRVSGLVGAGVQFL